MTENMSSRDRALRIALAIGLGVVAVLLAQDLRYALPAALAAVVLMGTALTSRCPLYALFGISTCDRTVTKTG
ncbi:MAG: DUF2892 domain-containing protein [Gemmatimonadales bacterium]